MFGEEKQQVCMLPRQVSKIGLEHEVLEGAFQDMQKVFVGIQENHKSFIYSQEGNEF